MKKKPTNIAASVHARLLNEAKAQRRPFNELLQYYAMERFLYRLSRSSHRGRFVLKGALMLQLWGGPRSRSTMDIDLLGLATATADRHVDLIRDCLDTSVEDDGLQFDPESVEAAPIRIEAKYDGVRLRFRGRLGTAEIVIQVDVGFGDVVTPSPATIRYPTLLELPAPELLAYTAETSIAEKLEAMVTLDIANSRMKDFFDIAFLSAKQEFDGALLARAIAATFQRRGTPLPASTPLALTPAFSEDKTKAQQWSAFVRKTRASEQRTLAETVLEIAAFIMPVLQALRTEEPFERRWPPNGPWMHASNKT